MPEDVSSDVIVRKYNLQRKYQVIISDKKVWKEGPPVKSNPNWNTNGPKIDNREKKA